MIACSVVDLPAPFGPIRPTISPRRDLEREVAHGCDAAVGDVDAPKLQHRRLGAHAVASCTALSPRYAAATSRLARISVGRSLGERRALVEHLDPVADVHDQRHVVVDQQHAGVVVVAHRADDGRELGHLGLGEPGRRLVHQDEAAAPSRAPGRRRACARRRARAIRPEHGSYGARPSTPRSSSARCARLARALRRRRAPRPRRSRAPSASGTRGCAGTCGRARCGPAGGRSTT